MIKTKCTFNRRLLLNVHFGMAESIDLFRRRLVDVLADAGEVGFHCFAVVALDDVEEFGHL